MNASTFPSLILISLGSFVLSGCSATKNLSIPTIEESMRKALVWQEANPIQAKAPTDWTNGAYYTGVAKAYETTEDPIFLNAIKDMGMRNEWNTWERFYHADDVAISYSYLTYYEQNSDLVNLVPTRTFLQDHFHRDHEWKNGTAKAKEKKILWWWCDALFMAPPVVAKWSRLMNEPQWLNEMHHYYRETYDLLFDQEESLFARDTRFQWTGSSEDLKEANGKKIFWSRGNGWVLGGLALLLEELPEDFAHRSFYEDLYRRMSARIVSLQPKDGLWRTSLLNPDAYDHGEVSGSGFYTFALTWGINQGILDRDTYQPAVLKAWKALQACQHENGKVGWVQNIGAEPKPASFDSWQNYGTGAFLLAASEIIQLVNK